MEDIEDIEVEDWVIGPSIAGSPQVWHKHDNGYIIVAFVNYQPPKDFEDRLGKCSKCFREVPEAILDVALLYGIRVPKKCYD
jgi:hypothetical protein